MNKECLLAFLFVFLLPGFLSAEEFPPGKAMIWQQPIQPIQKTDLFWGSGGESQKPVGPFLFEKEDTKGTNPKIYVTDQRGVRWGVKFGDEVHSEVAASRFFWASGFRTADMYLVKDGVVQGATGLGRSARFVDSKTGNFKYGRFKKDPGGENVASVKEYFVKWKWNDNPFVGTKELSGLMLLNALIVNVDTKSGNNTVQSVTYKDGTMENWYMVSDIGSTFGGSLGLHGKWHVKDFQHEPFLGKSDGDLKVLHGGRHADEFRSIPLEHARWFDQILANLSREQIEIAFRAALSDTPMVPLPDPKDEKRVKGFAEGMERRLGQLHQMVGLEQNAESKKQP